MSPTEGVEAGEATEAASLAGRYVGRVREPDCPPPLVVGLKNRLCLLSSVLRPPGHKRAEGNAKRPWSLVTVRTSKDGVFSVGSRHVPSNERAGAGQPGPGAANYTRVEHLRGSEQVPRGPRPGPDWRCAVGRALSGQRAVRGEEDPDPATAEARSGRPCASMGEAGGRAQDDRGC